jgi:hypothetical protein
MQLLCAAIAALCAGPTTAPLPPFAQPSPQGATVTVALDRPLASFAPAQALGGALDGHSQGETAQIYTPRNLRLMAGAGLGQVSYRLRTELGVQAWHIDPAGDFSEPSRRQGYWTSTGHPSKPAPRVSWGYTLPRRGDTVDQAEDNGYSRIDDGRLTTFWKSDPYLASPFTHEPEASHPQWVLIELPRALPVDAIRIAWAAPYATRFRVQRFVGPSAVEIAGHPPGRWRDFAHGAFAGHGGVQTLRLARAPQRVRFVRVLMSASSHTAPRGARDIRDRVGYAIRELYLGRLVPDRTRPRVPHGGSGEGRSASHRSGAGRSASHRSGEGRSASHRSGPVRERLLDLLTHRPSGAQSVIYTSSTDPWHRARDRNPGYEQPSFQTVLRSGLTHGEPLLVPVPVLYGTPANAVAELRYLRALGVPLRGVELGEEPDGQLASPEDYGALYIQFARAIHRAFPRLALGGPGFQTSIPDWLYWPDAHGDRSWMHRFLDYLRARGALARLRFFSFEWYPYDNVCADPAPQLAAASDLLVRVLARQRAHGLPPSLPVYITEYGYSAFAGQDEVDLPGALLDADTVGTLLREGGAAAYLYGYEPATLMRESESCDTWGNLALWQSDERGRARRPLATFWETQMLTHDWVAPGGGTHTLYAAGPNALDGAGHELVRAYALRRPDGRLAVLLLNMSPSQPYQATVRFNPAGAGATPPSGALAEWQLSAAQYHWLAQGPSGHPSLDVPPERHVLASWTQGIRLPPYSITVLRSG